VQDVDTVQKMEKVELTPMEVDPVLIEEVKPEEPVLDIAPSTSDGTTRMTSQERAQKLAALRVKMRESAVANRKDLIEESQRAKMTAREIARIEKQRKLAEILREKVDAQENGVDVERKKNWEYSIEEDLEWQKRLEKKARRADFEFHDETQTAHRKYKKDLDLLKPDLIKYSKQKEVAFGLEPGALVNASPTAQQQIIAAAAAGSSEAADYLYRDANTLLYADSQPSEDAIDRVVNKLNTDLDKRAKWSRKRLNTDEGDITYINERNRVFNKKISRYYDKYTKEIRESFERGTAV